MAELSPTYLKLLSEPYLNVFFSPKQVWNKSDSHWRCSDWIVVNLNSPFTHSLFTTFLSISYTYNLELSPHLFSAHSWRQSVWIQTVSDCLNLLCSPFLNNCLRVKFKNNLIIFFVYSWLEAVSYQGSKSSVYWTDSRF